MTTELRVCRLCGDHATNGIAAECCRECVDDEGCGDHNSRCEWRNDSIQARVVKEMIDAVTQEA